MLFSYCGIISKNLAGIIHTIIKSTNQLNIKQKKRQFPILSSTIRSDFDQNNVDFIKEVALSTQIKQKNFEAENRKTRTKKLAKQNKIKENILLYFIPFFPKIKLIVVD